jgi:hypothetical protein
LKKLKIGKVPVHVLL